MIDHSTQEPLTVRTAEEAGPYIIVPVDQVDEVSALLDSNGITYWVDEGAVSLDGEPPVTFVNFKRGTDPQKVQAILDAAS